MVVYIHICCLLRVRLSQAWNFTKVAKYLNIRVGWLFMKLSLCKIIETHGICVQFLLALYLGEKNGKVQMTLNSLRE